MAAYTPERVQEITGVSPADLEKMSELYATRRPATLLYAMGITQHTTGVDNVKSVCNLAMLTGNVGVASSGVNPLRGQNNVQGACDMGGLPNVFPGYQQVANPEANAKFSKAWGRPLSDKPGRTLPEMITAMSEGKLKALYVIGENPKLSDPDANHLRHAFKNLELLIVQDLFLSETAQGAHVVLPAASSAEKDGTFTNTERRCMRLRQAIEPRGQQSPRLGDRLPTRHRHGLSDELPRCGRDFPGDGRLDPELCRYELRAPGHRRAAVALPHRRPSRYEVFAPGAIHPRTR